MNTNDKRIPGDRLWTVEDLSYFLSVPVATFYYGRCRGEGPACSRIGRHLRYSAEDVRSWVDGRTAAV